MWILWDYSRILGGGPWKGTRGSPLHPPNKLVLLQKSLPSGWRSLREGLVHRALRDPATAPHRPALLRLLSQALGLTSAALAPATSDSPQAFVTEMEVSSSQAEPGRVASCPARAGTAAVPLCPGLRPHGSLPPRVSSSPGRCWSS